MEEKSENTKNLSKQMLRRASTGMIMDFLQKPCKEYDAWLEGLPKQAVEGLADECAHWIRCWGSGGGDYSTEACITEAIRTEHSNCAPEIAVTIFESVANYSKSAFEASILTMEIVNESLRECGMEL